METCGYEAGRLTVTPLPLKGRREAWGKNRGNPPQVYAFIHLVHSSYNEWTTKNHQT